MSSYVASNDTHFAVDQAATSQDMLEIVHNIVAIKEFPKRIPFGGDPSFQYTNTSYQSQSFPVYCEIDGSNLDGLLFELHFMAKATSGDVVSVQLWNRTTNAMIVELASASSVLALVKSLSPFSLITGVNIYEVRVKSTIGGASSPFTVYGATLVQK